MANKSIHQLPNAVPVSTDELEKQVTAGGASQNMTVAQLLTFIQNNAVAFTQAQVDFSSALTAGGGAFRVAGTGAVTVSGATGVQLLTNGSATFANQFIILQFDGSASFGNGTFNISTAGITTVSNDVEVTDTTKGFILKSPNGTRFRISVDNGGNLGTNPA